MNKNLTARQGTVLAPQEREAMEYDVVIVGAGPAGLSAAIRLKQIAAEQGNDISVCVIEKGAEVGAHILSGAVVDPIGLDALLPEWREADIAGKTPVHADKFLMLGRKSAIRIPNFLLPSMMRNEGSYIASLGNLCRWLGEQAEALGVEIYPGFAAAEALFDDNGALKGVATGDMGVGRNGEKKDGYTPGVELHGKYTFLAEGARGSLSKYLISHFKLDAESEPQKYGIGIKEVWEVPADRHSRGLVQHTLGWPLDNATGGGSFLYHMDNNLVAVGFVVHLNYGNPYLSPFEEFQRFKTHPAIREVLQGGRAISYGARAITEGGWQSIPELVFPGGALIGCAAGFVNVPRIKGSHNAVATGMMAADAAARALSDGRARDVLDAYPKAFAKSSVAKELKRARNLKPLWSRFGLFPGVVLAGLDLWLNQFGLGFPWTFKHGKTDASGLSEAKKSKPINYPKADGKISFDRLTCLALSGVNHEEDQPVHLRLGDDSVPVGVNLPRFAEPAQRYCPAGVYEILEEKNESGEDIARFQINAQNCVHCKTCDIKDPSQNIDWTVPEGGGGPNYSGM
ncbi:MAG: electron transfer flavoprotein-ubiquinone oxidoreductase [Hyphomicrobiales bacterium]|nr:electron transfer flavoprotein-ubiquinone oxidoreductase [Hyphomicrobiales bacterium]MCY4049015.1 electron transfer flavoprotein-ubiquinone oxidoreductase [Hyphomicrobiales bacterium]